MPRLASPQVPRRVQDPQELSSHIRTMWLSMPTEICMWSIKTITEFNDSDQVRLCCRTAILETYFACLGSNTGTTVAGFSLGSGGGRSELYYPGAIQVDPTGLMYILDTYNCRVMTWKVGEPIGTVVVNGRGCGSAYTTIGRSYGLFIDSFNNIYISENVYHRVTLWYNGNNTAGTLVRSTSVVLDRIDASSL